MRLRSYEIADVLDRMLAAAIEADYGIQVVGRNPGNCSYHGRHVWIPWATDIGLEALGRHIRAEVRKLSEYLDLDGPVYARHFMKADFMKADYERDGGVQKGWVAFVAEKIAGDDDGP